MSNTHPTANEKPAKIITSPEIHGKRPWRGNLKERYIELVNTFVNTNGRRGDLEEERNFKFISEMKGGGAAGTRTPCLFNAIEALSQLSYSPILNLGWQINFSSFCKGRCKRPGIVP